ncbi:MAG: TauD/TfdA family dioxygenase [Piscinibacter sp.]
MSTVKALPAIEPITIAGRYQHIRPQPQQPNFAAHIEGVDLTRPLPAEVTRELRQALLDFEVIFLPPQAITLDQHVALAEVFGPVAPGAFFPRKDGHPLVEVIAFDEQHPPEVNIWHSDLTWLPEPPNGTVIQIVEPPPHGGGTTWASLSRAYAALSPGLQQHLASLTATHTWEISGWREAVEKIGGDDALLQALKKYKPVQHPVVRRHPESGRDVLFVNENFTRHIDGVHFRESRGLLEFLREWIVQPEFTYTHKWQKNAIAIWDNRSTQHYALADYWPQRRVNHRVTFNSAGAAATQTSSYHSIAGQPAETAAA